MTADDRFSLLSIGRPFTPTMAAPSGSIVAAARQQLIYTLRLVVIVVAPFDSLIFDVANWTSSIVNDAYWPSSITDEEYWDSE